MLLLTITMEWIRYKNRRAARDCDLRNGHRAPSCNHQIGPVKSTGHIVNERKHSRLYSDPLVSLGYERCIRLPRLMYYLAFYNIFCAILESLDNTFV